MAERYFIEVAPAGAQALLRGTEAHHLAHVMRARVGDEVVLFDGQGTEFLARVERIRRDTIDLTILSQSEVDREAAVPLTVGVALPKGDRQRWLVEKLVEVGVARIVPLATSRSVARVPASAQARLERTVVEASKQCGRTRLAAIQAECRWNEFVASAPQVATRLVAHPGGASLDRSVVATASDHHAAAGREIYLAIGPEGGLTEEEVAAAKSAGWTAIDLGPRILRVETAALVLAALALWCGDVSR